MKTKDLIFLIVFLFIILNLNFSFASLTTFNFSTSNGLNATACTNHSIGTPQFPENLLYPTCSGTKTDYTSNSNLDLSDNLWITSSSVSPTTNTYFYFVFNISNILTSKIINFSTSIEAGHDDAGAFTGRFFIMNHSAFNWTLLNSTDRTSATDFNYTGAITSSNNISHFVNQSLVYLLWTENKTNSGETWLVDFIKLDVTHNPTINITSPLNNTNHTTNPLAINYSLSSREVSNTCKYTTNSGVTNTSISCGTNISFTSEGLNINLTLYINESDGTQDSSSLTFSKDSVAPSLTLVYPAENDGLTINTSIGLNFSVSDLTSGVQACWFNIDNGANTTITSCLNTTFNTSEGGHTAYIYANDTFGNLASDSNFFQISLTSPVIVLNYPNNNTYFNNGTNIYLNYTATDGNGISSCQIWHDLNGTFSNNQTNTGVTSAQMNYTVFNISQDNNYKWNIFCNDTGNAGGFSVENRTFTIDTTLPVIPSSSIDITTPVGGQSITINVTSFTELNCNNSFYSVYDSSGAIENGISNRSLTSCTFLNDTFDVNDVPANTYNLTIFLRDKAGNENSTTKQFSTIAVSGGTGGGGGGGSTTTTQIPVIALQDINSSEVYSDLTKAILYSTINNYCSNKINKEPLAIVDYSQQCQLTTNDLQPIINNLKEFAVDISEEDLRKFIENYKQSKFLQTYATEENIKEYGLFTSVLGETTIWLLTPPSIDSYFTIFNREGTVETLPRIISSNKGLKSCEVVSNTPNLICEVTSNYTAKLSYEITDTSFFTKTFSGTILLTTDAEPERTEQRRSQVTFRVINFGSNTAIYSGAGVIGIVSLLIFIIVKRRRIKFTKQVRELISLK